MTFLKVVELRLPLQWQQSPALIGCVYFKASGASKTLSARLKIGTQPISIGYSSKSYGYSSLYDWCIAQHRLSWNKFAPNWCKCWLDILQRALAPLGSRLVPRLSRVICSVQNSTLWIKANVNFTAVSRELSSFDIKISDWLLLKVISPRSS